MKKYAFIFFVVIIAAASINGQETSKDYSLNSKSSGFEKYEKDSTFRKCYRA